MSKKQFNPIIQTTTDYSNFKILKENRNLNEIHLKRLKQSMIQNPLISLIIVNDKMEIIDGQHRFHVCKDLGLPINYVMVYGYGIKEVQILNVNSVNWRKVDYLDGHIKMGLEPYIKFKNFMKDFPQLNFSTCLKVLSGLRSSKTKSIEGFKGMSTNFEDGKFIIPDIGKSYNIASMILDYRNFFPKFNDNTFIITLLYLFEHEKYSHKEMMSKLKLQPKALEVCKTQAQYISILEDVFNYHRKNKVSFKY
jgi:hypothetical protein